MPLEKKNRKKTNKKNHKSPRTSIPEGEVCFSSWILVGVDESAAKI